ncbi:MAG: response regulator transcription factor [Flavobacteriaceae bacterium]|nr:response regulator transcription factor [Flavobacteriaceae bacterium]
MKKKDTRILLVDDEPDIIEILTYNLSNEGYQIETAINGRDALEKANDWKPHLVLLDVMMPEMDGIETCEQLRKNPRLSNLVIVFLTARSEDYSQVAGLEAGADDYITKPIKPKVLTSKIKAALRRFKSVNSNNDFIEAGDLVINREEYKIIYKGKDIILPRKEFELVSLLASKPQKVFEREEILNRVWGNEVIVGGRTIDVHIRKLREKIGDQHFKTVKGVGYKYVI